MNRNTFAQATQKRVILLLTFFTLIGVFAGCKKGDDDPAISFLSRKARLCNKWEVTSGVASFVTSGSHETDLYSSGSNFLLQLNYNSYEGTYYYTIEIKKDGTYSIYKKLDMTYYQDFIYEENGNWYFMSKNKDAGYKNKECVAMQPLSIYDGTGTYTYTNANPNVYDIVELRNKKVVLSGLTRERVTEGSNIDEETVSQNLTLEPAK